MQRLSLEVYGKCILSGEHSVLRGCPALVVPVFGRKLSLEMENHDSEIQVECHGKHSEILDLLFWGILDKALERVNKSRSDLRCKINIQSNINIGAGLGASAALCVAVTRVIIARSWLMESDLYEFSRSLEDIFHGESSGVDIAVAMESKAIRFVRGGTRSLLKMNWKPNWYLSYSGEKGITSECIDKVKQLIKDKSEYAKKIDDEMNESVELMESALVESKDKGQDLLIKALNMGRSCFEKWKLVENGLSEQMDDLIDNGALAVKPTGSGNGGFVLSLWANEPPKNLNYELIEI